MKKHTYCFILSILLMSCFSSALETYPANTVLDTGVFDIKLVYCKTREDVGKGLFKSQARQGSVYVAVQWVYRNTTDEPVSSKDILWVYLEDSNGVVYKWDVTASINFAIEREIKLSRPDYLNPQVIMDHVAVFEVAKSQFDPNTWKLRVDAPEDFYYSFQVEQ